MAIFPGEQLSWGWAETLTLNSRVRPVRMIMAAHAVAAGASSAGNMSEAANGPTENSAESQKRLRFGTRFLTDPRQVFQHIQTGCLSHSFTHSLLTAYTDTF